MKKTLSLLANLLLLSALFHSVRTANADVVGGQEIVKETADAVGYCHMKFPPMRENTLSWQEPAFESGSGNSIDFYGRCDHNPLGAEEVKAQREVQIRENYGDSGD
jgi:hypothetical protein